MGGQGLDLGSPSTVFFTLHAVWQSPPGISTAYEFTTNPGLIYVDRDQTSNTGDVSAVVQNSGNRPLVADFGRDSQTTNQNSFADLSLTRDTGNNDRWILTATRRDPFPYSEVQVFEDEVRISTADDFAVVSKTQHWRVRIEPPAP